MYNAPINALNSLNQRVGKKLDYLAGSTNKPYRASEEMKQYGEQAQIDSITSMMSVILAQRNLADKIATQVNLIV
jgi:hypothetical protein